MLTLQVPITQILYIDFEDDRLQPMNQQGLSQLLDSFYSLYTENHAHTCYLFLDELQTVKDWPLVIRRFLNTKNVKIYLSGSSAKMLSKEIATSLRGREITVEVWPYSFYEYLEAKGHKKPENKLSRIEQDKFGSQLRHFLEEGGFPEVTNKPKVTRTRILQDYVSVVTYRDIVERHKVENVTLLDYMIRFLIKNASTPNSANKMYNSFKSQGFSVGRETVYDYLKYIEDAFLIFMVPIYSESIRAQHTTPNKIYVIDNGLINAFSLKIKDLYHKFLENQVYLDLRRQGKNIFYYNTKDGYEIDFVTVDKNGERDLIQVTWDMSDPATFERELRALAQAEEELGIKGRIITSRDYAVKQL